MKFSKRGLTQIDWILSLSFFLLYITWFFIIIKPGFEQNYLENDLHDVIIDYFEKTYMDTVEIIPFYTKLNYEPTYVVFSDYEKKSMNYTMYQDVYVDDGWIFFQAEQSINKTVNLLYSSKINLEQPDNFYFFNPTASKVSTVGMTAKFNQNILDNVVYDGNRVINEYYVYVQNQKFTYTLSNFRSSNFYSKYYSKDNEIEIFSYVFADNQGLYQFLKNPFTHEVRQNYKLERFENYYVDDTFEGNLDYVNNDCSEAHSNFINFNSNTKGLLFLADKEVSFRFCKNSNLDLNIISNSSDIKLIIIPHDGNLKYNDYKNLFKVEKGSPVHFSSYGLSNLKNIFNVSSYLNLKETVGYPSQKEFKLDVYNHNIEPLFSFGNSPGKFTNIKVKQRPFYVYDNQSWQRYYIYYSSW